jgi:hypothetical protein
MLQGMVYQANEGTFALDGLRCIQMYTQMGGGGGGVNAKPNLTRYGRRGTIAHCEMGIYKVVWASRDVTAISA